MGQPPLCFDCDKEIPFERYRLGVCPECMEERAAMDKPEWARERMGEWENCATPDCENKVCTWAHKTLCYPCAEAVLGKEVMRQAYINSHDGMTLTWSDEPGCL